MEDEPPEPPAPPEDPDPEDAEEPAAPSLRGFLWQAVFLILLVLPICFLLSSFLGALLLAWAENWTVHDSFGFMCAAITGGAVLMAGGQAMPTAFGGRLMAALVGSAGTAFFGVAVAALQDITSDALLARLGLSAKRVSCRVFCRLLLLMLVLICFQMTTALLLGSLLAVLEGWTFVESFKTILFVQFGGGLPLQTKVPSRTVHEILLAVCALWAMGLSGLCVSATSSFCTNILLAMSGSHLTSAGKAKALAIYLCLTFFVVPIILMFAMSLVSLFFMMFDPDSSFEMYFWLSLPAVGGPASVSSITVMAESLVEHIAFICASVVGLLILCSTMNILSTPLTPLMRFIGFGESEVPSLRRALGLLMVTILVVIPAAVAISSLPLAAVLAPSEGWRLEQAFWWVVSCQLGGGMALTNAQINTLGGRFFGTIACGWSMGISALALGLAQSPALQPLLPRLTTWPCQSTSTASRSPCPDPARVQPDPQLDGAAKELAQADNTSARDLEREIDAVQRPRASTPAPPARPYVIPI